MPAKLILLPFLLALTAAAQSPPSPYSVKADRLGETVMEWTRNNPESAKCDNTARDDLPRSGDRTWAAYCLNRSAKTTEGFTYGTAPLLMQAAWFHNDSLYRVEMTLLSDESLPDLMSALKQKFGKPVSKRTTRVQNGFGSQFQEKRLTWTNKISTLELTYSTVPGRRPSLAFTLEAPRDDAQSKRAQTTKACADM
jgi:hypothetical protein